MLLRYLSSETQENRSGSILLDAYHRQRVRTPCLKRQLSAGPACVAPSAETHRHAHTGRRQARLELLEPLRGGRGELGTGPGVDGDEIDMGFEPVQPLDQGPRLPRSVVDAVEHRVLDGDAPADALLPVLQSVDDLADALRVRRGDDAATRLLVG